MWSVLRLGARVVAAVVACAVGVGASFAGQAAVAIAPNAQFRLSTKPGASDAVVFRGIVNGDADAGQANSMLYVMPAGAGIVGLFAAIATHGTLVESGRQSAISKAQEASNGVLKPYSDVLEKFSNRELIEHALDVFNSAANKKLLSDGEGAASHLTIESTPVFAMSQDQSALVLDNSIVVRDATLSDPVYQIVVRVVSDVQTKTDPQAEWLADQGKQLRSESTHMFAHSLRVLMHALQAATESDAEVPYQTFRYSMGKTRKVERAQLVQRGCDRLVIKTLRGWMLSIPQPMSSTESPGASSASDKSEPCIAGLSSVN